MAKKSNERTYRDIIDEIKKGLFHPVYLLMGEEPYYIDLIVEWLEEKTVPPEDRDFNFEVFYGADADIGTVANSSHQYPVMADRKLVILKEAQSLDRAKAQLDKLAPYVSRPNKSTVLAIVFKGDTLGTTSAIMKAAAESDTVIFKSPKIKDYQLAGPVKDYCRSKKIEIDEAAVNLLCEYIGSPLSKIFSEIDKLVVATSGKEKRITPATIERNIGISKDFNNFELIAAIRDRNYAKAMMIARYFRKNPKQNPTVLTSATLFKFFTQLCIALFESDKSDSSLMQALELKNSYALRDIRGAMQRFNATQAVNAIHAIRDFDSRSKGVGSAMNEYDLLDELLFRIFT